MTGGKDPKKLKISFVDEGTVGSGAFGVVKQVRMIPSSERLALKTATQDPKYKVCSECLL